MPNWNWHWELKIVYPNHRIEQMKKFHFEFDDQEKCLKKTKEKRRKNEGKNFLSLKKGKHEIVQLIVGIKVCFVGKNMMIKGKINF